MKKFLVLAAILVMSLAVVSVKAISEPQEKAIVDHCKTIRSSLKDTQRADSRTRVYLGEYYDKILTDFVTPLNMRLVENNLSTAELVENQNKIADTKTLFNNDFVSYQQDLEELVLMDCADDPAGFYDKLVKVRQKRKIVEQDTLRMRSLISTHVKLANQLKGKL